jgi:CBS domain containing-hemolysin-like protein
VSAAEEVPEVKRKVKRTAREFLQARPRNDRFFDIWSLGHLTLGIVGGWVMDPLVALLALVVWEPLEILVLSPFLARFGIEFGHETLRNSLSDIAFDSLGIAIGFWGLTAIADPPFHWF